MWSALDVFMRQGAAFLASVVLARLLRPEDFGAIAALQVFTGLASVLVDSGLSASLIRRRDSTRGEESTVFYFNVAVATVLMLIIWLAAEPIARLLEDPGLTWLVRITACNLPIGALASVHNALLSKHLDFRTIAKVTGAATLSSSLLAIVLAYAGWGVWSLCLQGIVANLLTTVLLWALHGWRPERGFDFGALQRELRFGGYMALTRLLDSADTHLTSMLIATLFSRRDLGYYNRAQGTQALPINLLTGVVNRVAFSVFSEAAADPPKLAAGLRRAQTTIMWLHIPAMLGLAVLAEPLVAIIYGQRWLPSVPLLQVLCLVGLLRPLHVLNLNALTAQGRSDLFFRLALVKKTVIIGLTVAASFHGVLAMAWAQFAGACFAFFVNAHHAGQVLKYGALAQLRDLVGCFLLAFSMAGLLWFLRPWTGMPPVAELALLPCLGALLYVAASWYLRLPAARQLLAFLARRRAEHPT